MEIQPAPASQILVRSRTGLVFSELSAVVKKQFKPLSENLCENYDFMFETQEIEQFIFLKFKLGFEFRCHLVPDWM